MQTVLNIIITIAVILFALWIIGLLGIFPIVSWLLNIAIIVAVILLIIWLLKKVFKLF